MFTFDRAPHDETRTPDRVVAALAARQGGVVSVEQLHAAGLDGDAIMRRARAGRLHWLGGAAYAVGHTALGREGRLFAAVLATGDGSPISHRSAASAHGFLDTGSARIDVLTTSRRRTAPPFVRLHRTRDLPAEDVVALAGVPVTSVARTLVDLAAVVDGRRLERAVHEAEVLRLLDVAAVHAVLARSRGRRGTGRLRRLVAIEAPPTKSELERLFVRLCRRAGLPAPEVNEEVGPYTVDALWRAERLIVETDGGATHDTRKGFEQDRRRDVVLAKAGFHVVRFTWRRVVHEPRAVADDVGELLAVRADLLGVRHRSRGAR